MPQPTQELQDSIQSLHAAIAAEPDPEDKATLGQCLTQMMKVQAKNMAQEQQEGGGQAQQAPPAAPPDGAVPDQGGVDPRLAMLAQLGGGGI